MINNERMGRCRHLPLARSSGPLALVLPEERPTSLGLSTHRRILSPMLVPCGRYQFVPEIARHQSVVIPANVLQWVDPAELGALLRPWIWAQSPVPHGRHQLFVPESAR